MTSAKLSVFSKVVFHITNFLTSTRNSLAVSGKHAKNCAKAWHQTGFSWVPSVDRAVVLIILSTHR